MGILLKDKMNFLKRWRFCETRSLLNIRMDKIQDTGRVKEKIIFWRVVGLEDLKGLRTMTYIRNYSF